MRYYGNQIQSIFILRSQHVCYTKHIYVLQTFSSNKAIIPCHKLCVKLFSLLDRKVLYVVYLNEAIQLNGSFYMILYATAVLRWCFGIQKHVHNVLKRET